ncbi:MAG: mandelate racemase/muconate lactonizing enzyme family protein [Rhodobacteraceae bacterium]|nr:mandelate racemase/muconate lactonizing enzyme family protein [Paracoccaceae bacterium]
MRITNVATRILTHAYDGSVRNTRHAWTGKDYLFVSVEADDGSFGLGECYCSGPGAAPVVEAIVRNEIAPLILGEDPRAIRRIQKKLRDAHVLNGRGDGAGTGTAGVDIALWDLLGKICGQPLFRLLGGFSDRAAIYGSSGMYGPALTPERLAEDMARAVAGGLGGIKIKGAGDTLTADLKRVAAVRAAIGPDARLMVDAMFAPDVPSAIRMARALEPYGLHFLEAPTAAADLAGWRSIRESTSIPLAGPELASNVDLMRDYLTRGIVHFLQFDVTIAGGLTQGLDLAALAGCHHRPVTLHCSGSAIGTAASAHLAAAVSNCDSMEFHLMHQFLHEHMWDAGFAIDAGALVLPDRPGLGIDLRLEDLRAARAAA